MRITIKIENHDDPIEWSDLIDFLKNQRGFEDDGYSQNPSPLQTEPMNLEIYLHKPRISSLPKEFHNLSLLSKEIKNE